VLLVCVTRTDERPQNICCRSYSSTPANTLQRRKVKNCRKRLSFVPFTWKTGIILPASRLRDDIASLHNATIFLHFPRRQAEARSH
jgi:hypothetical protein